MVFKKARTILALGLLFAGIFLLPKLIVFSFDKTSALVLRLLPEVGLLYYGSPTAIYPTASIPAKSATKPPGFPVDTASKSYELTDNRADPSQEYMFKLETATGKIEIGDRLSGLPAYRITDKEGRFFTLKYRPDSASEPRPAIRLTQKKDAVWFIYRELNIKYAAENPGKIKAEYLIKSKPQKNSLNFDLSYAKRLSLFENTTGNDPQIAYFLVDGTARIATAKAFGIYKPDIKDAAGMAGNALMAINGFKLKLSIPERFIGKSSFPLRIDPTITQAGVNGIITLPLAGRKLFKDSHGNWLAIYLSTTGAGAIAYSNNDGASWTVSGNFITSPNSFAGAIDNKNLVHLVSTTSSTVFFTVASPSYNGGSTIASLTISANVTIFSVTKNTPQSPTVTINHEGFPAIAWTTNTANPTADSAVYFAHCKSGGSLTPLNCKDANTNWCNSKGSCGAAVYDKIYTTAATGINLAVTLAQVPSGATSNPKDFFVYWSRSASTALQRAVATCSNCTTSSSSWNSWSANTVVDSSTVSATRYTDVHSVADSTNNRIAYDWASQSTTDCGAATTYCLLTTFRDFSTASASNAAYKSVSAKSPTETNVDTKAILNFIASRKKYYIVAILNPGTSASLRWYSMVDTWTSWSGKNELVVGTDSESLSKFYAAFLYAVPGATVRFEKLPTYNQSAYRWFNNKDVSPAQIGSTLTASQNTVATAPNRGTPFRLRMLIHNDKVAIPATTASASFKFQYVDKGSGSCASPTGGANPTTYTDLAATGSISFYTGNSASDNSAFTASASVDPTHSGDSIAATNQTYETANNFLNSQGNIASGSDGMWDFALIDNSSTSGVHFCFRAVESDNGSVFDTYSQYPEIITSGAAGAATITLTLDAGGQIAFGSISPGNQRVNTTPCTNKCTTRLRADQTGASSLNITAGRQRAISNVTLASNAAPTLNVNQISDTAGGIDVFTSIANCSTTGANPAVWPSTTGTSSGLGFSNWAASTGKNTTCWGSGASETDTANRYAALQASASAASFINITASPPATLYTSVGYSLEVTSSQKATSYNGAVIFTATALP